MSIDSCFRPITEKANGLTRAEVKEICHDNFGPVENWSGGEGNFFAEYCSVVGVLVRPFIIDTVHVFVSVRTTSASFDVLSVCYRVDRDESENPADLVQVVYHLLFGNMTLYLVSLSHTHKRTVARLDSTPTTFPRETGNE